MCLSGYVFECLGVCRTKSLNPVRGSDFLDLESFGFVNRRLTIHVEIDGRNGGWLVN